MKKILAIIGARPQFIKHAPIELAFRGKINLVTVHTGQHYDERMSQVFFDELKMAFPQYMLNIGSHSHGIQTAQMMLSMEPLLKKEKPDAVLVYGDTNSTLAGALVAAKLHVPVIHIEAGLRSFNKQMPEEVNRILTDHMTSLFIVPTQEAIDNLAKEGLNKNIYLTGDVMCDMVRIAQRQNLSNKKNKEEYYYTTIHRPYNTDNVDRLKRILDALNCLDNPVYFSIHPRTRKMIASLEWSADNFSNITFLEPVSYFENIKLQSQSKAVITDSGGIQKEAYILKKRCVTVRTETEWVETLQGNWNTLVFDRLNELNEIMQLPLGKHERDMYGDGFAAQDIVDIIQSFLE